MNRTLVRLIGVLFFPLVSAGVVLAGSYGGPSEKSFQVRFGGFFPEADSSFWRESEEVFTLDGSDFDDFVLGLGLVYSINNSLEIGFNADFYDASVESVYREFPVDTDGFPILHDTRLEAVPVTFDVRLVPGGRFRIRGSSARQVLQPVFYVGGGAGLIFWNYEERGDFLDFSEDPPEIFFDRFKDSGTALEVHVLAGIELPLSRRTNFLIEGRHAWADDDLDGDFAGLGELDLGGTSAYAGLSFRF